MLSSLIAGFEHLLTSKSGRRLNNRNGSDQNGQHSGGAQKDLHHFSQTNTGSLLNTLTHTTVGFGWITPLFIRVRQGTVVFIDLHSPLYSVHSVITCFCFKSLGCSLFPKSLG